MTYYRFSQKITNKVIFHGSRFIIFEIDRDHPYQSYEKYCNLIVFDKKHDGVAACCSYDSKAGYSGEMAFGQASIDIKGQTIKELLSDLVKVDKWIIREMKG